MRGLPWGMPWRSRRAPEVALIGRAGCHLCEEMAEQVDRLVGPGLAVRHVDLDAAGDPALLRRYTTAVPVLLVDGREVARWRADDATVAAALRPRTRGFGQSGRSALG